MIIFATIRIKKTTINKLHTIMESNQELIISCENKAKEWLSSSFNEETRKEATEIFTKLGFDMNTVVNLLLRSIILEKGIPFDLNKLSKLSSLETKNDFTYFNAETIEAIEETERNLKNSNRKRYSSIQELREALENN